MLIRLIKASCVLMLLSTPVTGVSEELAEDKKHTWYSVEYIIFKINSDNGQDKEPWTKEPFSLPDTTISFNTIKPEHRIKPLRPSQLQLHGAYNRLNKLASYTPLNHAGWLQELNEEDSLRPIHVLKNTEGGVLDGIITFRRGRFLHLDLDLQLNEQDGSLLNQTVVNNLVEQTPTALYRLKQTRRIKTGDLHFFDHPRFGVMTKVEKVDGPVRKNAITEPTISKPLGIIKTVEQPLQVIQQ